VAFHDVPHAVVRHAPAGDRRVGSDRGRGGQGSLQTYSNGKIVRWIAPDESADTPAPHLDVTAAQTGATSASPAAPATASKPTAAVTTKKNDTPSKGLVIVALVLGALGLLTGIAAIAGRRRTGVPTA
jgi:hypothetical protein